MDGGRRADGGETGLGWGGKGEERERWSGGLRVSQIGEIGFTSFCI